MFDQSIAAPITGTVWNQQRFAIHDLHEPRRITFWRDIHTAVGVR